MKVTDTICEKDITNPPSSVSLTTQNVAVFGLGKVGLTLAACLSNAGNCVTGVDISSQLVKGVNDRTIQSNEPGVMKRLHNSFHKFSATTNAYDAVEKTNLAFIITPTPSNTFGAFSLRYVLNVCEMIGKAIKALKKDNYIISVVSTIFPGSSEQIIIPKLEEISGRKIGEGLGYCYNPSFIALGEVVQEIENPDYVLIGEADSFSGDAALEAHRSMINCSAPIARMSPIEAEITKLASNTHETMRVSFANMIFSACTEIPGANVDLITNALSHRMGKRFFKGAIPFGGPCWLRDNKALSLFLEMIGVSSRMPQSVDIFNNEHGHYIFRKILEFSKEKNRIGIIGLAYKPGTCVIECSYPVNLIQWLIAEQRQVIAWDPLATEEIYRIIGDKIAYAANAEVCFEKAEVIVIAQPLKDLCTFDWSKCRDKVVIDCWRALSADQINQIGLYIPLGNGQNLDQTNSDQMYFKMHFKNQLKFLTN